MYRRTFNSLLGKSLLGAARGDLDVSYRARPPRPSYPWVPDERNGFFRNPVLFADYSDPDVIRVGGEFFLTASSFNCTPALPILVSRDLVNWSLAGHALENLPDPRYAEVRPGEGIWAPSLREHAGIFYLFAPTPDEGIYVLTAGHPRGPWSEPRLMLPGKGLIDPCPLWDDDGQAYLVHAYARSRAGIKDRLRVRPMAPDATRVLGEGEIVYCDPQRQPTLEGPKFYKRNGFYYILAPAGGVGQGWQLALRARTVFGPYESRVVLAQGTTDINGPHQGALVDTPRGESWFLHFQDAGVYGRVVHLNPVVWRDDWPLIGEIAQGGALTQPMSRCRKPNLPVQPIAIPETSDDFNGRTLRPAWQWQANHRKGWFSLSARPGHLRLFPQFVPDAAFARAPNLLLQKLPARAFRLETRVAMSASGGQCRAGLVVMGDRHAAVGLEEMEPGLRLSLWVDQRSVYQVDLPRASLRLVLDFADGGHCRFSYAAQNGELHPIEQTFAAQRGRWTGAKVGLFALALAADVPAGFADFAYFRFDAVRTD